jgi:hypothetical protein
MVDPASPIDLTQNCVRYSCITQDLGNHPGTNTNDNPAFNQLHLSSLYTPHPLADPFVIPGQGTLHPATSESIRFGAETGGEMGAYGGTVSGLNFQYCLQDQAILDKLSDFLPLGIEAVLIPDPRMLYSVPTLSIE